MTEHQSKDPMRDPIGWKKEDEPPRLDGGPIVAGLLISLTAILIIGIIGLPLFAVFFAVLTADAAEIIATLTDPDTLAALRLTLLIAAIAVPTNGLIGLAAAWAVTKYEFPGKTLLMALIDIPFSVSPVVAGLVYVLLFGAQGLFGSWLDAHNIKIIFAVPGITLATLFVTFPFVARELIPLMQAHGKLDEEAALTLGASGWTVLFRITLPKAKWGLLYGLLLCNARAMGEFGAVSVVSGHIRGLTNTLPLHVEVLYNEYQFKASFIAASLLASLALVTLILKSVVEYFGRDAEAKNPIMEAQN
jgi:sulfate/thiosulfate transport system permease protein